MIDPDYRRVVQFMVAAGKTKTQICRLLKISLKHYEVVLNDEERRSESVVHKRRTSTKVRHNIRPALKRAGEPEGKDQ